MDKTPIIICTRPDSARVPGKVFRKIAGVPAIEHILNRVKPSGLPVILAVPAFCELYDKYADRQVQIFRGYDKSPLHRMAAAKGMNREVMDAKYVIRITHDDLLIDCKSMMDLLSACESEDAGYGVMNGILNGAGVEVIAGQNLMQAAIDNSDAVEHISYFVQNKPNPRTIRLDCRREIRRDYRLTLDYPEDALLLEIVLRRLGPNASCDEICAFIDTHPWLINVNRQPMVSVYTCAYNAEDYIERTILSVLRNGFSDIEYIIVDDGSTDETLLEIAKFADDPRIKIVLSPANEGLASASNRAISKARGRYVLRVDADDQLIPGAIESMLRIAIQEDAAAVYPAYHKIDGNGNGNSAEMTSPHTFALFRPDEFHHAGCALMNTKILNEVRFKDGLRHWDSLELYSRLSKRFNIAYMMQAGFFYRQHSKSLSKSDPATRERIRKEIGG